ncbi:MAG: twitching motility protein PilT [Actinomycetota bacterium]|jgi:twitching motility protein PilT|nr:twitching motility protein PilT [Actinomycetota bacterium]
MAQITKQLGDVLLEQGVITRSQLDFAQEEEARTGESAWRILVQREELTERDLVHARAVQIGLPFVDVRNANPPPQVLTLVGEELSRRQMVLPIAFDANGHLVVAMAEPTNHLALDELARTTSKELVAAASYHQDLLDAIERIYGTGTQAPAAPAAAPAQPAAPSAPVTAAPILDGDEREPNLAEFLYAVLDNGASDLHLTVGLPPTLRLHGELQPLKGYRKMLPQDLQELIYSMLTQKQREIFEENLELDLSYTLPGVARFRVNVFQQRGSIGSVMRLIPFEIKDLDALGLPSSVKEFASLRRGLCLITGVTGSGKSTTLAGLIDLVNSNRREHIMTVEDPIEFLHNHKLSAVNQREVGTDTHGFADALKHALRQDPDVILVGELRDLETISTALTAAETGHLVFATLHTQDAPQSIDRIIDVFPPHQQEQIRVQLAGTIAGIVSQQLIPTSDGKGRAVAAEVLIATPAVRNLIREAKTHQIYTSMQAGGKFGMQVMDQNLAELVKKGRVTYDMALERCHHVEEFNRLVGKG